MSDVTQLQVEEALQSYQVPHLNKNLLVSNCIEQIAIQGGLVTIVIVLPFPAASLKASIQTAVIGLVSKLDGVENVSVEVSWLIASAKSQRDMPSISGDGSRPQPWLPFSLTPATRLPTPQATSSVRPWPAAPSLSITCSTRRIRYVLSR